MFRLELTDSNILKTAFDSISHIVEDITFTVDSERMRLRALDKSHIIFITLDLQKTVFDEYECDKPDKVAVDSKQLYEILKKCKPTDIIRLEIDTDNLIITFDGDAKREFKIRLIDIEYDNPTPPKMDYSCKVGISSGLLKDYINDMEIYSDRINFTVDGDYLKLQNEGQEGEAEISYLHGENIFESVRACYDIGHLKDIFRASKFSKECEINIGEDMPLQTTFTLPSHDGKMQFLLAPRINADDD